ncbi:MAG: Tol-Pal system beta propeller repeat protein TolB [Gammaproteobacteria bacterium]|nr:Tol-Pal system beta propeller repeat protein TolB [Gammaproteobacteria bacterium]
MKRILVWTWLAALAMPAAADLQITVTGGDASALPIAVVPFETPPDVQEDLAAIIEADLARTGLFRALPRRDMLEKPSEPAKVDYRSWRAVGVEHLIVGRLQRPNGKLQLNVQLLDVVRGDGVLGHNLPMPNPNRVRPVAHQAADLIYEKLTGMPGVFSTQIAYVTASGPADSRLHQLVIADADGANPQVVATSREPLMSPAWSPDRKQLAYVGFERNRSAIYIHTLATGELKKIVSERGINGSPAWSPDGTQLAVTMSFEQNPDIYVIDIASGARRRLTDHFAIDTEAAWSPDGREIAFTSDRGGQPQVYVVATEGGLARRLTFEGRQNLRPRYSPDGRLLALVNYDDMGYRIGILDLRTRELRIVSDGPLDESPSFSPNGAVVIYAAQGRNGAELATATVDGRVRQRLHQAGDVREPAWSPLNR